MAKFISFDKIKSQFGNTLDNAKKSIEGQDTSSKSGQDVFEEALKGSGESLFQKAQNQQASNVATEGAATTPKEEKPVAPPASRTPEQGEDKTSKHPLFIRKKSLKIKLLIKDKTVA